jgi:iron(III) transport system substrate-binding protein
LRRRSDLPLDFHFAASGVPVIKDAVGLVNGAPHAAEAKAYIDWVGSLEAQELAAHQALRLPARTDLPPERLPAWAREVLATMTPAPLDWELMAARGPEWMATWDRSVRGRG